MSFLPSGNLDAGLTFPHASLSNVEEGKYLDDKLSSQSLRAVPDETRGHIEPSTSLPQLIAVPLALSCSTFMADMKSCEHE